METLTENKLNKIEDHSVSNLQEETIITIKQVWDFAHFNNYVYNRFPKNNLTDIEYKISKMTLNERRRLKTAINCFRKKQSLSSANRFYQHLYAKVLMSDIRIRLSIPEKQKLILEKRNNYLKLRDEMLKALSEYKTEKGDYFKLRLLEGKKI
jgi:hypothetical protein